MGVLAGQGRKDSTGPGAGKAVIADKENQAAGRALPTGNALRRQAGGRHPAARDDVLAWADATPYQAKRRDKIRLQGARR
jgi:hypothetical protein